MLSPDDETPAEEPSETEEPQEADGKPADGEGEPEAEAEEATDPEAEGEGEEEKEGEEAKDGEEEKTEEPPPEAKRKRAGGWQRRIDRLERQNQLLVEQLSRGQPAQTAAEPAKEASAEEKAAAYVRGLLREELAQQAAQDRQKAVVTEFQRRTAEVRAAKEDFDDVVLSADIPAQSALGQALLTSEHGPAIMYALAKSPAELARISALPPLDAAREVGRLEAKLSSSTPPAKTSVTAKRPPAPPTSVNGSKTSTRSLEDLPLSDYKRAYRAGRR